MKLLTMDPTKPSQRLLAQAVRRQQPLSGFFELTYRCNFACPMCYIRMTDEQAAPFGRLRTIDEWLNIAEQMRDAGVLFLTLTGGECTRYPGFSSLYVRLSKMGFRLSIMTNAARYPEDVKCAFSAYPPSEASVTLYGGSDATYALVTGDPNGFTEAKKGVAFLRSLGTIVNLSYTVIRQNALDYIKARGYARSLGLSCGLTLDLIPHMYDASYSTLDGALLTPAERACFCTRESDDIAGALADAPALEEQLADFQIPTPDNDVDLPVRACAGSQTGCAIRWNGAMNYCLSYRSIAVKPFEVGFVAAWRQLREQHAEAFRLNPVCAACALLDECALSCPGRFWEGTRDPRTLDRQLCEYVYLLHARRTAVGKSGAGNP